jgi:tetratricopeptide (TPR) repeat protein
MSRHPQARFYAVPNSIEDAQAGGLLIVPDRTGEFGPRVLPCAMEHGKVAVLCTTLLDPLLSAEEAQRLLVYFHYFFHPALGLVAFEETDAIQPETLIVSLLPRKSSWVHASPGHPRHPRLTRVSLLVGEDEAGLFGDAADEIGRQSPTDLQSGAPFMQRLRDKIAGGAASAGMGFMKALGDLAKRFGANSPPSRQPTPGQAPGGSRPGTFDRLARWASENFEKLQQMRQSEVDRLMKLLESDPDLGLRYALPLTGDGGRGQAPPGWQLGERNPLFGRQRTGGPADVWNLAPQTQWQLQQKYRELANRELAAGRYERAAYIFAELLGDWHAAAGALARGRLYQEAARIYLTKLNNKTQAAQCLEEGGLLADAILLYAELNLHEKCGDLWRRLGSEHDARLAYQEAMKGSTDRLHDARILFEKLDLPALALSVLATGYPNSPQAAQCLERHFDYLSRLDADAEALRLAGSLGQSSHQIADRLEMTKTLRAVHQKNRNPEVRSRLTIVATSLIGEALSTGTSQEKQLLMLLPQFADADLLLRRDADRYGSVRESARQKEHQSESSTRNTKMVLLHRRSLKLPKDGKDWHRLVNHGERWLAVGFLDGTRQGWALGDKGRVIGTIPPPPGSKGVTNLQPAFPYLPDTVWLPLEEKSAYFQATQIDFALGKSLPGSRHGSLSWMPPGIAALHPHVNGVSILHRNAGNTLDLSSYTYDGRLLHTHALGWAPPRTSGPTLLASHGETSIVTVGPFLIRVHQGKILNEIELPGRILKLQATQLTQPAAFLAVMDSEVILMTPGKGSEPDTIQLFSGSNPRASFLNDGRIAAGDKNSFLLYGAYPSMNLLSSTTLIIPGHNRPAPADYAAWGDGSLVVLYADGTLDWFG